MRKLKKLYEAIKNRRLMSTIKCKMKHSKNVFYIKNQVVKNSQLEEEEYKRVKKKYRYVLERERISQEKRKSNKVWICWLQGINDAPIIVQKCIKSIKEKFKESEVIILDLNNYSEYVEIPNYIKEKFEKKMVSYTHFSDLLRIALLSEHGGIWIDATVLCTGEIPKYITESELFVYKNINLDKTDKKAIIASNWLISAYSHNDIIETTRDLLFEYWKKEKIIYNYFIFHIFFKIATEKYKEQWDKVPSFNNINPHMLQFELLKEYNEKRFEELKAMSTIHKLDKSVRNTQKEKYTFLDYILKNY